MDPNSTSFDSIKQNAYTATQNAADMTASAPGLLGELKKNLTSIFAKDNPVLQARDNALSTYLATPDKTRAEILTPNLPQIEPGRQMTLSPTQQQALVSSRSAAAFAPLAGLNEIIKGMYGSIGDAVSGAGDIYKAQIGAANTSAGSLIDLYKTAVAELNARNTANAAGGGGIDIAAILAALNGGGQQQTDPYALADSIYGTPEAQPAPEAPAAPEQNWLQKLLGIKPSNDVNLSNLNGKLNIQPTQPTSGLSLGGAPSGGFGTSLQGLKLDQSMAPPAPPQNNGFNLGGWLQGIFNQPKPQVSPQQSIQLLGGGAVNNSYGNGYGF